MLEAVHGGESYSSLAIALLAINPCRFKLRLYHTLRKAETRQTSVPLAEAWERVGVGILQGITRYASTLQKLGPRVD